jgi:predicted DNA-binding transcriptional regulator YafY
MTNAKDIYMMKTERLLSIIILLLQRKKLTAKELAEHLEVSIRTIYRDIDSINLAGIPIVSHQGMDGGYEILSSFMLQNQALNVNDRNMLLSTLKGISALFNDEKMEQMIETIGSSHTKNNFTKKAVLPIVIDFSPWGLPNTHTELLSLIKKAIEQKRELQFFYLDSNSKETERQVQPAMIVVKAGIPYLYGYCLNREDTRIFRVSRIRHLSITNKHFQIDPKVDIDAKNLERSWVENSRTLSFTLLFHPRVQVLVEEAFTPNQMTLLENGYMQVECQFPEGDWVTRFLLSFGRDVQILKPEEMKRKIRGEAQKILELYE